MITETTELKSLAVSMAAEDDGSGTSSPVSQVMSIQ